MKLQNRSNRTEIVELDHSVICEGEECLCSDHQHRSRELNEHGEVGERLIDKKVNRSVHILPRSTTDELPESVVKLPRVRELIRLRVLAVVKTEDTSASA